MQSPKNISLLQSRVCPADIRLDWSCELWWPECAALCAALKFAVTLMLVVSALLCSCWKRQCLDGCSLLCQHVSVVPWIPSVFLKLFFYVAAAPWLFALGKQNAACEILVKGPVAGIIVFLLGIQTPAFGVVTWMHCSTLDPSMI